MESPVAKMAPIHFYTLYGTFTVPIKEIWTQG